MKYQKGHEQSNTGRTHFRKGFNHTEDFKQNMSERLKGNTYGFKKGRIPWNKGLKGYMSGEKNCNWKGGITELNDSIRKSEDYNNWRFDVYKRDNYICQKCDIKCTNNIVAHHIKSFADNIKERFEINNGITLCRSCHKKIHKDIGMETRFREET